MVRHASVARNVQAGLCLNKNVDAICFHNSKLQRETSCQYSTTVYFKYSVTYVGLILKLCLGLSVPWNLTIEEVGRWGMN